jgi:hypothetical protein
MRLFFGIIIGIVLTVGGAYIADSMQSAPPAGSTLSTHMVNWDVVQQRLADLGSAVHGAWDKITGKPAPAPATTTN